MKEMENKKAVTEDEGHTSVLPGDTEAPVQVPLPLEIRVHGRGGQGGVTCAKLCSLVYSRLGLFTQTFGDYGMERTGAPIRAYTRVDRSPIKNRNKVYVPGHLLILDPSLFGEDILDGAPPGSLVLLNTREDISAFHGLHEQFRFATVNATEIARKHGIGTAAVVIVNTAIVGAYARVVGFPIRVIEETYSLLGLQTDLLAAKDAYHAVAVRESRDEGKDSPFVVPKAGPKPFTDVIALTEQTSDIPTRLKTGAWRTQSPLYRTFQAPCHDACPAGNDIPGFIQALKQDGVDAAARVLLKTQALPSVCGRVCPAPCGASCNRSGYDGSVNIRGLERWVGDHASEYMPEVDTCDSPLKIAVVGGGPAGLGAAFALTQAGHHVTVYESQPKLGGVLRSSIPTYRLPEYALDQDIKRLVALGIKSKCGQSLNPQNIKDLAKDYDAVMIATGQAGTRSIDCQGVHLSGVEQGLGFLNRVKIGGSQGLQGNVIVIGGGNTAVDCARTALRCGATKVSLVYRRGLEEMPAIEEEIEEAIAEGVELILYRQPVTFLGDNRVTGIEFAEIELGDPDESGRKRPLATNSRAIMPCNHVLLAAGQYSDLGILPSEWIVKHGRGHMDDQPLNVWLSGDVTTGAGTVSHAVGHGRRVACDLLDSLSKCGSADAEVCAPTPETVMPDNIRFSHFPISERHQDRHLPVHSRTAGFQEVDLGLDDSAEAERCFSCGQCTRCDTCLTYCPEGIIIQQSGGYFVNGDYCKGCGICVWECPRHAMQMIAQE